MRLVYQGAYEQRLKCHEQERNSLIPDDRERIQPYEAFFERLQKASPAAASWERIPDSRSTRWPQSCAKRVSPIDSGPGFSLIWSSD